MPTSSIANTCNIPWTRNTWRLHPIRAQHTEHLVFSFIDHQEKKQRPQQARTWPRQACPLPQLRSLRPQGQGHQALHRPQHGRSRCCSRSWGCLRLWGLVKDFERWNRNATVTNGSMISIHSLCHPQVVHQASLLCLLRYPLQGCPCSLPCRSSQPRPSPEIQIQQGKQLNPST